MAALVPGLLLLLVAGAVVDAYAQSRERRRWQDLAVTAAGQFVRHFAILDFAIDGLLGVDIGGRTTAPWEFHLSPARRRAADLFPTDSATFDLWEQHGHEARRSRATEPLPTLLSDEDWRSDAVPFLWQAVDDQSELLARRVGVFAGNGRRRELPKGRIAFPGDRAVHEIRQRCHSARDLDQTQAPSEEGAREEALGIALGLWDDLRDRVVYEIEYWIQVLRQRREVEDPFSAHHEQWHLRVIGEDDPSHETP